MRTYIYTYIYIYIYIYMSVERRLRFAKLDVPELAVAELVHLAGYTYHQAP